MKNLRTLAAIAAASALPAFAGGSVSSDLSFTFDLGDVLAEAQSQKEQWTEYGERMREWADEFTAELQGSLAFTFSDRVGRGKVVKGAPYSADVVSEMNQALSDGNVITHQSVNKVFRDGEGRTRQETFRKGELRSVYISDPVAGVSYTIVPRRKLAVVSSYTPRTPRAERHPSATESGPDAERERNVVVRRYNSKDTGEPTREEVTVEVIRVDDDNDLPRVTVPPQPPVPPMPGMEWMPPMVAMPGMHTMHFESTASLGKGVTSKLAAKDVNGVKAEGTQTVWTIPAGKIGNRNAINITRETWTSPDLQVTVLSRYNDPRTGESVYRLAGIKRAEPSADLFKLPEGYTVKKGHSLVSPPVPPVPPVPPTTPVPSTPPTSLPTPPAPQPSRA